MLVAAQYSKTQRREVTTYYVSTRERGALHCSIQQAIDKAEPFSRIVVAAGQYFESISVTQPIELIGEEGDPPEICSRGVCVSVNADVECFFEGLHIVSKSAAPRTIFTRDLHAAVRIIKGKPTFYKCKMTSVYVGGHSYPCITNCQISGNIAGCGLVVAEDADGEYLQNSITNHIPYCVLVKSRGTPVFTENTIYQEPKIISAMLTSAPQLPIGGGAILISPDGSNVDTDKSISPKFVNNRIGDEVIPSSTSLSSFAKWFPRLAPRVAANNYASALTTGSRRGGVGIGSGGGNGSAFDKEHQRRSSSGGKRKRSPSARYRATSPLASGARRTLHSPPTSAGGGGGSGGAPQPQQRRSITSLVKGNNYDNRSYAAMAEREQILQSQLCERETVRVDYGCSPFFEENHITGGHTSVVINAGGAGVFTSNHISHGSVFGVNLHPFSSAAFKNNIITQCSTGILIVASNASLTSNTVNECVGAGCVLFTTPKAHCYMSMNAFVANDIGIIAHELSKPPKGVGNNNNTMNNGAAMSVGIAADAVTASPHRKLSVVQAPASSSPTMPNTPPTTDQGTSSSSTLAEGGGGGGGSSEKDDPTSPRAVEGESQKELLAAGPTDSGSAVAVAPDGSALSNTLLTTVSTSAISKGMLCLNKSCGALLVGSSLSLTLEEVSIGANGPLGVIATLGASPTIQKCHFDRGPIGLLICEGGNPTVSQCKFEGHLEASVSVEDHGKGSIRGCEFKSFSKVGVRITDAGAPIIEDNSFTALEGVGVDATAGGMGIIQRNAFNTIFRGIVISMFGDPYVFENKIRSASDVGILVNNEGCGSIVGNRVVECGVGIASLTGGEATIRDNTVMQSSKWGVYCGEGSLSIVEKNRVVESFSASLFLEGRDNTTLVRRNVFEGSKGVGVRITNHAEATIIHNRVVGDQLAGIVSDLEDTSLVAHNTIEGCVGNGITIGDGGASVFEFNEIHGGHHDAIHLAAGAKATIRNCKARDNSGHGLVVEQGSGGTVTECIIHSNGKRGVAFVPAPPPPAAATSAAPMSSNLVTHQRQRRGTLTATATGGAAVMGNSDEDPPPLPAISHLDIFANKGGGIHIGNGCVGCLDHCTIRDHTQPSPTLRKTLSSARVLWDAIVPFIRGPSRWQNKDKSKGKSSFGDELDEGEDENGNDSRQLQLPVTSSSSDSDSDVDGEEEEDAINQFLDAANGKARKGRSGGEEIFTIDEELLASLKNDGQAERKGALQNRTCATLKLAPSSPSSSPTKSEDTAKSSNAQRKKGGSSNNSQYQPIIDFDPHQQWVFGIQCVGSKAQSLLTNCTIKGNDVGMCVGAEGEGTLHASFFKQNTFGDVILLTDSNFTIKRCEFGENIVIAPPPPTTAAKRRETIFENDAHVFEEDEAKKKAAASAQSNKLKISSSSTTAEANPTLDHLESSLLQASTAAMTNSIRKRLSVILLRSDVGEGDSRQQPLPAQQPQRLVSSASNLPPRKGATTSSYSLRQANNSPLYPSSLPSAVGIIACGFSKGLAEGCRLFGVASTSSGASVVLMGGTSFVVKDCVIGEEGMDGRSRQHHKGNHLTKGGGGGSLLPSSPSFSQQKAMMRRQSTFEKLFLSSNGNNGTTVAPAESSPVGGGKSSAQRLSVSSFATPYQQQPFRRQRSFAASVGVVCDGVSDSSWGPPAVIGCTIVGYKRANVIVGERTKVSIRGCKVMESRAVGMLLLGPHAAIEENVIASNRREGVVFAAAVRSEDLLSPQHDYINYCYDTEEAATANANATTANGNAVSNAAPQATRPNSQFSNRGGGEGKAMSKDLSISSLPSRLPSTAPSARGRGGGGGDGNTSPLSVPLSSPPQPLTPQQQLLMQQQQPIGASATAKRIALILPPIDASTIRIKNNNITENQRCGILCVKGSKGAFVNNKILKNRRCGVIVEDSSTVLFVGNRIEGNAQCGIIVRPNASPSICKGNKVKANHVANILLEHLAKGLIYDNAILAGVQHGIVVKRGVATNVFSNTLQGHEVGSGVLVDGAAPLCNIKGNVFIGNHVGLMASPSLQHGFSTAAAMSNTRYYSAETPTTATAERRTIPATIAMALIEGNTFTQNSLSGILLERGSALTIMYNLFEAATCCIQMRSFAGGIVRFNTFTRSNEAISIAGGHISTDCKENTFSDNRIGFALKGSDANYTLKDNTFGPHDVAAVVVEKKSTSTITNNSFFGGSCGIIIKEGSRPWVRGNVADGCLVGIEVSGASAVIDKCLFTRCGEGIIVNGAVNHTSAFFGDAEEGRSSDNRREANESDESGREAADASFSSNGRPSSPTAAQTASSTAIKRERLLIVNNTFIGNIASGVSLKRGSVQSSSSSASPAVRSGPIAENGTSENDEDFLNRTTTQDNQQSMALLAAAQRIYIVRNVFNHHGNSNSTSGGARGQSRGGGGSSGGPVKRPASSASSTATLPSAIASLASEEGCCAVLFDDKAPPAVMEENALCENSIAIKIKANVTAAFISRNFIADNNCGIICEGTKCNPLIKECSFIGNRIVSLLTMVGASPSILRCLFREGAGIDLSSPPAAATIDSSSLVSSTVGTIVACRGGGGFVEGCVMRCCSVCVTVDGAYNFAVSKCRMSYGGIGLVARGNPSYKTILTNCSIANFESGIAIGRGGMLSSITQCFISQCDCGIVGAEDGQCEQITNTSITQCSKYGILVRGIARYEARECVVSECGVGILVNSKISTPSYQKCTDPFVSQSSPKGNAAPTSISTGGAFSPLSSTSSSPVLDSTGGGAFVAFATIQPDVYKIAAEDTVRKSPFAFTRYICLIERSYINACRQGVVVSNGYAAMVANLIYRNEIGLVIGSAVSQEYAVSMSKNAVFENNKHGCSINAFSMASQLSANGNQFYSPREGALEVITALGTEPSKQLVGAGGGNETLNNCAYKQQVILPQSPSSSDSELLLERHLVAKCDDLLQTQCPLVAVLFADAPRHLIEVANKNRNGSTAQQPAVGKATATATTPSSSTPPITIQCQRIVCAPPTHSSNYSSAIGSGPNAYIPRGRPETPTTASALRQVNAGTNVTHNAMDMSLSQPRSGGGKQQCQIPQPPTARNNNNAGLKPFDASVLRGRSSGGGGQVAPSPRRGGGGGPGNSSASTPNHSPSKNKRSNSADNESRTVSSPSKQPAVSLPPLSPRKPAASSARAADKKAARKRLL